jgi:peptidoglycan/LPS O-acetylase OafA/YrhL
MSQSPDYRPDIDGLRAVAVLPVVLFHAGFGFPGGFVGVDIFFVISGYLITGLILKDLDAGTFSLTQFWERRVRRIMPPLLVMLAVCSVIAWNILLPNEFQDFCASVAAQAVMLSNMWFCLKTGYFQPTGEATPLLNLWSLAVEEQFYLVLPLALMAAARFCRSWILPGLVVATVLSFAACVFESYTRPNINYYMIYSRAWELLVGSLVLYVPPAAASRTRLRSAVGFAGLLAIGASIALFNSETRFPGIPALLPCLGAAALIWAGKPDRSRQEDGTPPPTALVVRWLSWPLLRAIGLISYSLYLWHWPLLVFTRMAHYREPSALDRLVVVGVSFVLAIASWYVVETPFRRRIVLPGRAGILVFGAASLALMFTLGYQGTWSDGYPQRFSEASLRYGASVHQMPNTGFVSIEQVQKDQLDDLGGGGPTDPIHCLVWGDSHAGSLRSVFQSLAETHQKRCVTATHPATPPLLDFVSQSPYSFMEKCPEFSRGVVDFARRHRVQNVILICYWGAYAQTVDQQYCELPEFSRDMLRTVTALRETGANVWILKQVPVYTLSVPQKLARMCQAGLINAQGVTAFEDHNRGRVAYHELIESMTALGAKVLEPRPFLADAEGNIPGHFGGESLYADTNHLSPAGALLLRPLFEPVFTAPEQLVNSQPVVSPGSPQTAEAPVPVGDGSPTRDANALQAPSGS